MLFQSDTVDEVKVGIENLLRRMSAQHPHQQVHNTFYNQRVAFGAEHDPSFPVVGLQPHPALATVYQVLFGLVLFGERFLPTAHVDEQLVFVHPVIEAAELINDLVLYFVTCFHFIGFR